MKNRKSHSVIECATLEARRLFCIAGDHVGLSTVARHDDGGTFAPTSAASSGPESIDTLIVPAYNSRPGATQKLFLDFNGAPSIDNWGGWWEFGGYTAGPTQAYDIDGDNNSFSNQELANIEKIWKGVAEKYSPFDINVSTVKPAFSLAELIPATRVVIGGDGSWYDGGGGVAIVGSNGFTATSFVWGNPSSPTYVAEAVAHEAGHQFGLYHQSRIPLDAPGNEYAPGLIMGNGDAGIGRWANTALTGGTSSNNGDDEPSNKGPQDDLDDLTDEISYRPDVVGDTIAGSAFIPLVFQNGLRVGVSSGVIERNGDVDMFRFTHEGGELDVEVLAAEFRGMLNPALTLRSGNTVIATSTSNNGSDGVGERIQLFELAPGSYSISISGTDGYGDIGQYRINVRAGFDSGLHFNNTLGTASLLGAFGATDTGSIAVGFGGTAIINDTVHDVDQIDYFKIKAPANINRIFAQVSNTVTTTSLAIYDDLNGNGVVDPGETVAETAPATGVHTLSTTSVTSGKFYYVRVEKPEFAPSANYTLRLTTDTAPTTLPPSVPAAPFDPQPLVGGRTIYESIDVPAGDTFDCFRVTAKEAGLFSFYLGNFGTDSVRLDVADDQNQNGTIDPGEILGSANVPGPGNPQTLQNVSVSNEQKLLVRVVHMAGASATKYTLLAVADYAIGGNINGSLSNPHFPDRAAGTIYEYLDARVDFFDTFKIFPQLGEMRARFDALGPGASHKLEIIRDVNGNSVVDPGEVVASGFTGQNLTYDVTTFADTYLRVQSVYSDEFFSHGNYKLSYATAGSVGGFTPAAPGILSGPFPIQVNTTGYLGFEPNDPSLTNLKDYYQFTINSRTRFDANIYDPYGLGIDGFGLQIGTLDAQLNFHRLSGIGSNDGVVNSVNVNLDPGTYILRTYLHTPERQDVALGGTYGLAWQSHPITDNTAPTVTGSAFQYEIAAVGASFVVSEDVLGTADASDVIIRNLATNTTYPIGTVFYDQATRRLGYGVEAGTLPDGNYRATLLAGSVRDRSNNPLAADHSFDFFVLAGDANRDRRVNLQDFNILAANFGQSPRTFSQGDFNYDSLVDLQDFNILAARFGVAVAPGGPGPETRGANEDTDHLLEELT